MRRKDRWFHSEPEVEERMHHIARKLSPCELIRQLYAKIEDPEIRLQLRILTTMNKSMALRLKTLEGNWGMQQFSGNPLYFKNSESPVVVDTTLDDIDTQKEIE